MCVVMTLAGQALLTECPLGEMKTLDYRGLELKLEREKGNPLNPRRHAVFPMLAPASTTAPGPEGDGYVDAARRNQ